MSKAVDVKIQNVLGANLARPLVEHANIYTGVWVNPFPPWLFFSLFSPLSGLFSISSPNPHYTGSVSCSAVTDRPSCCCRGTASSEIRTVRAHACIREAGREERKNGTDTTWRAKGWLIRKLAEIIAGLSAVFAARVSGGLWMWGSSNLETRWGQGFSLGRPVPAAEVGLKQSWGGEILEELSSGWLSVLRSRQTSNKPALERIKETCINPGNKLRMWERGNWSLSIQGPRITKQDMHVDALWLLRHEIRGRAALKGGSGLVIRSCSGLRTVCTTYGRCCGSVCQRRESTH